VLRARDGFGKLNDDQRHHVLRPITEALFDTNAEQVHPPLKALADGARARIADALAEANDRLDKILSEGDRQQVVKLASNLRNREVRTEQELEAVLEDLRQRVSAQLRAGHRVRLV